MRKNSIPTVLLGAAIFVALSACNSKESFVIKADDGQSGAEASITMTGTTGTIATGPLQSYPAGLNEPVTETSALQGVAATGQHWGLESKSKVKLSFNIAAGHYICDSCLEYGLPLNWHRVGPAK